MKMFLLQSHELGDANRTLAICSTEQHAVTIADRYFRRLGHDTHKEPLRRKMFGEVIQLTVPTSAVTLTLQGLEVDVMLLPVDGDTDRANRQTGTAGRVDP